MVASGTGLLVDCCGCLTAARSPTHHSLLTTHPRVAMTVRPPKHTGSASSAVLNAVEAEVIAEQAASLARASRRLEKALATLAAFDAGRPLPAPEAGRAALRTRPEVLAEAREALWFLVVQREACGFRNSEEVLSAYAIPAEISAGMVEPRTMWRRRPRWL